MFKIGDKVVCVYVGKVDSSGTKVSQIELDSVYTVQNYIPNGRWSVAQLCVEEVDDVYYAAKRFKKVDIHYFRKLKLERVLKCSK